MLAGRESLIRLVGKRRRNLPRDMLLLDPQSSLGSSAPDSSAASPIPVPHSSIGGDGKAAGVGKLPTLDFGEVGVEWVTCPVCGKSICGSDYNVNSHLDSCLTRGTKRKLTQRTLLQLNFCTKSIDKRYSEESGSIQHVTQVSLNHTSEFGTGNMTLKERAFGYSGRQRCISEAALNSTDNEEAKPELLLEKTSIDTVPCKVEGPLLSSLSLPSNVDDSSTADRPSNLDHIDNFGAEEVFSATLETFIVGHRFHCENELSQGTGVYILRDQENPKDHNALKVVCSDSELMLGFLPRELAKYLSPLMDRYHLKLEGSVASVSRSFDAIPIQLLCQGSILYSHMEVNDVRDLKLSWGDVLQVVENGKTNPLNTAKYQQNFHVMIQEVLNRHIHLFMDDEISFLDHFRNLSDDGQRVFIRLYTRKGPWFRVSNISYPEVLDIQRAIEELQLAGYFCPFLPLGGSSKSDIADVLDVLVVSELREISHLVLSKKGINGMRKQEVIDLLSTAYEEGRCPLLPNMIFERIGTCVKIASFAEVLLWRIQRLFFLNGEQDISAFLLVDLGLVKYPDYTCNVSHPVFQNRNDLLAYEEAVAVAQIIDESIDDNNIEMVMRCIKFSDESISHVQRSVPTFLSCFSVSSIYAKVVTLGISFFERERRYQDAVKLLKGLLRKTNFGGKRGYWYLRLSVDLEHMGCITESLSVAEEGVLDSWVRAGSKIALQRRVLRLGKPPRRWKLPSFAESVSRNIKEVHVRGRPLNSEIGAKNRYYGYDGEQCSVEQLALQYYAGEGGWKGVHAESGIWLTIFGLLMWDAIFADIPDAFQTRFQMAPLDFGSDSFYTSREGLIESHLQKIHDGMAEEILISSWESHHGTACRGVNWDRHCLSDLRAAVSCIGGHCLASLCRHLAQDYRSWSSGMPDLLLWRFYGGDMDGGEAKLVEVKGPRDRLSEQQRAWMLILMDCGFIAEVCRVSAISGSP